MSVNEDKAVLKLEFDGQQYVVVASSDEAEQLSSDPNYARNFLLDVQKNSCESYNNTVKEEYFQSKENNTQTEEFLWDDDKTTVLLEEYIKRKEDFANPKKRKIEIWRDIQKAFERRNYITTTDKLDKKFRNVKQTYSRIKESKKSSGGTVRTTWKFYKLMDRIFSDQDQQIQEYSFVPQHKIVPIDSNTVYLQPTCSRVTKSQNKSKKIERESEKLEVIRQITYSIDRNTEILENLLEAQKERNDLIRSLIDKM